MELLRLAEGLDLTIRRSHVPPGTSTGNTREHRLGSYLSLNWHGQPLGRHGVIVNGITATTIHEGLTVRAEIDPA
jgi:hypothetical protein